jgi:Leucine-rich repeat (LRR) protein
MLLCDECLDVSVTGYSTQVPLFQRHISSFGFTVCGCCAAAGLARLPALHRLKELETLAASFNNISSLSQLVPVDAAAVAAAVTAAADTGSSSSSSGSNNFICPVMAEPGPAAAAEVAAKLDALLASKSPSALPGCLTQLGLAYNELACLPMELPAALPQLTSLDLSHNK